MEIGMVNKVEQYEIRIIFILGTYALSIDWVDFCWAEWHKIRVICQKKKRWGRLTMVAKKYVLVELHFFHSKHLQQ